MRRGEVATDALFDELPHKRNRKMSLANAEVAVEDDVGSLSYELTSGQALEVFRRDPRTHQKVVAVEILLQREIGFSFESLDTLVVFVNDLIRR